MGLETNLRSGRSAEVVRGAFVQEHNFVTCFHTEPEPAGIELHATTRIKHAVGVAVNNVVDLVVDRACGHRTTHAKVHEPAFCQCENPHWPRALDLQSKKAVQQTQVGTDCRGG